jgi:type I restriction enzyme S subunit
MIDYQVSVTEKSLESYKVVEKGDFIISLRSFQGGIEYSDYKGICSPAYLILRKTKDSIYNRFFKYYFKTERYIKDLNRNLEGIRDGKMVSYSQFSEIQLPLPILDEQQKIADCLSSLDDLIAAHKRKLEIIKAYKKGLMRELFPAECENIPRLRFPDFKNAGEWEAFIFGDIALSISSGMSKMNNDGVYPLYGSTGVIGRTNDVESEEEAILVARVGANAGLVNYVQGSFGATDNTLVIRINRNCDALFIKAQLESLGLHKLRFGSGQPLVTGTQLQKLKIRLPSLIEQKKVSECMMSVDILIYSIKCKIELLTHHKNGLMQQLFP